MQGQFRPQTPMLQQYFRLKAEYPDVLLAMQVGDFYEFYGPDAEIAARELEIVLTGREDGSNGRIPMAGVPIHAYERYFAKLVQKGYRVAICDQIEDPKLAKGLVKRRVTRVLTPGTVVEDSMLDARANNYLVAAVLGDPIHGLGIVDVSTGEFLTTEIAGEGRQQKLLDELFRLQPAEVLVPEDHEELIQTLREQLSATITPVPLQEWVGREGREILLRHFGVESLRGFGCEEFTRGLDAAALALRYLQQNQMTALEHIRTLATYSVERFMYLDATARRHLELTQNLMDGTRRYTLLSSIDSTCTPMGARLLKRWLDEPLLEPDAIAARLDAVDALAQQSIRRDALRQMLRPLADLERLAARASTGTANARDLVALRQSLQRLPALYAEADALLRELSQPPTLLATLAPRLAPLSDLCALLERALVDDPPADLKSGGVIRDGYDPELDRLRQVRTDGKQWIAQLEAKERQRTGIPSLKVGYNAVFGYYLEVSKPHLNKVPADYIRKQTLVNAERFITPELKEQEAILLGAEERINALEFELFSRVRGEVARCTPQLQSLAKAIAELDVLCAFAENAVRYRYVRPVVDTEDRIHIVGGRHPVVERFSEKPFVPNDCRLDPTQRLIILTGPNMSGKCLSGETLVFTERGIQRLHDLAPPDAPLNAFAPIDTRVQTRDGVQRATQFYSGGEQATIRLTTRLGFTLEGTPDHKVWTRREDGSEGWTRLGDLRPGDWVALARGFECWGNQTELPTFDPPSLRFPPLREGNRAGIGSPCLQGEPKGGGQKVFTHPFNRECKIPTHLTPDLAYWLGLLIGDGTITYRNAIVFSTKDPFLAEQFCELSERLFGYTPTHKANGKDYSISSTYLRQWLHQIGLDYATAATKRTPQCILCAPRECVVAYLQGLFDTDGYVERKYGNVFLTTASRQLALETQMLLLNLGIVASLREMRVRGKVCYELAMVWEDYVALTPSPSPTRWERGIGAHGCAPSLTSRVELTRADSLSSQCVWGTCFFALTPSSSPTRWGRGAVREPFWSAEASASALGGSFASALQTPPRPLAGEGDRGGEGKLFYDSIIRLEPSRAVVYDLNIEPDHNYIAQGFVSHNSTYIRQNALIVLMAHIGSFVPAERAEIGLVDRIFTRVGARDELATGQSTFMVEMTETANILNNATPRSLVILDEIGRGTSTYDGLAIAWAVAEYLHAIGCKTLFATHYHYLNELANRLEGVANYRVAVKEQGDRIVWLHKVLPGGTDRSYGVHVARMAGVPPEVVQRAEQILREFERRGVQGATQPPASDAPTVRTKKLQLTLFEAEAHPVLEALRALDITTLSPVEALLKLDELKRKLEE
jgi:DNA mismatch repair protein MutS